METATYLKDDEYGTNSEEQTSDMHQLLRISS